jgi:outer membrane lipoprotein-sorting protein
MAKRTQWIVVVMLLMAVFSSRAADHDSVLAQWLHHQTNITSWEAAFTQTRTLRALTHPLVSTGHVWFVAPQNFRWELGDKQTIAIRNADLMLVIYPKLKRAERYDFSRVQNNQWKDSLTLLQTGFPRSRAELEETFAILEITQSAGLYRVVLEPKSLQARKMMPHVLLYLDGEFRLSGTELVFADGSTMRNDFQNIMANRRISEDLFSPELPADFKIVEPLRGNK